MRTYLALSDALLCALLYSPVRSPALFCLLSCALLCAPVRSWALLGLAWALLSWPVLSCVFLCLPGLSWAFLGCPGLYRAVEKDKRRKKSCVVLGCLA